MTVFKEICKHFPVAPELGMHIAHIIVLIPVQPVVIVITALVRTEFLIRPPKEPGPAVKTYSFHSECFYKVKTNSRN